jgi:hypothetical protein
MASTIRAAKTDNEALIPAKQSKKKKSVALKVKNMSYQNVKDIVNLIKTTLN